MSGRKTTKAADNFGFTIIEVLIVLAVTALMFLSVALLINGKQRTTAFQTAVADIRTRIQQVATEVSNGYFPDVTNFGCRNGGAAPGYVVLTDGSVPTDHGNCQFLGKVLHFYNGPDQGIFTVYTLVGLQTTTNSYDSTVPFLAARSAYNATQNAVPIDLNVTAKVPNSMSAYGVVYTDKTGTYKVGSFAFMQSLNNSGASVANGTGSGQYVNVVGFNSSSGSSITADQVAEATSLDNAYKTNSPVSPKYSIGGTVKICFDSGSTNQKATITIGSGPHLDVALNIASGVCP